MKILWIILLVAIAIYILKRKGPPPSGRITTYDTMKQERESLLDLAH
jgi:hypothetical protein